MGKKCNSLSVHTLFNLPYLTFLFNIIKCMLCILFTLPTCWSLKLKKNSLLNRKVLQPDTHDRESCSASYRELSLAAELVAILSFCTESGAVNEAVGWGRGIVLCAVCSNIGM